MVTLTEARADTIYRICYNVKNKKVTNVVSTAIQGFT